MKKKMLFVCAAGLLTAGIASAEVPSYNIVGYLENKNVAPSYFTGPTFVQVLTCLEVDPNLGLTLSDIKIEGMDPMLDSIQFLSTEDAGTLISATYVEAPPAFKGWWDFYDLGGTRLDTYPISFSQGFLCNFESGEDITITYAGEVLPGEVTIDLTDTLSPVLANFLPVDLKLKHLKVEGMDPMLDSIQFLSPDDAGTLVSATYVEAPPAFKGWWDFYDLGGTRLDEEDLPAGLALLCNFTGYSPVKITFPDPTLPLAP